MNKEKIVQAVIGTHALLADVSEPERSLIFPVIFKIVLWGADPDNSGKSTITHSKKQSEENEEDFTGLYGGMKLLIKEGYFREGRTLGDMFTELKRQGYHQPKTSYSAILQSLTTKKRILTRYKDKGDKNWKYTERK